MSESIVKISRTEHKRLLQIETTFEMVKKMVFASTFKEPATKSSAKIMRELKKTGAYSPAFLKSISAGLSESTYFNKK